MTETANPAPAPAAPGVTSISTASPAPAISDFGTRISESGGGAPAPLSNAGKAQQIVDATRGKTDSAASLIKTGIDDIDAFLQAKQAAKAAGHDLSVYDYVNLVRKSLPEPSADDLESEISALETVPLVKSGHLTTEFWLLVFVAVAIVALAIAQEVDPNLAAVLDVAASVVYTAVRYFLKSQAIATRSLAISPADTADH